MTSRHNDVADRPRENAGPAPDDLAADADVTHDRMTVGTAANDALGATDLARPNMMVPRCDVRTHRNGMRAHRNSVRRPVAMRTGGLCRSRHRDDSGSDEERAGREDAAKFHDRKSFLFVGP